MVRRFECCHSPVSHFGNYCHLERVSSENLGEEFSLRDGVEHVGRELLTLCDNRLKGKNKWSSSFASDHLVSLVKSRYGRGLARGQLGGLGWSR